MNPDDITTQGRQQIVDALNIGHLTEAEQNEIVESLGTVLFKRVLIALLDRLPEEDAKRYMEFTQAEQHESAQAIVAKHIPNYGDIVNEELTKGIQEYVQHVNAAKAKQAEEA